MLSTGPISVAHVETHHFARTCRADFHCDLACDWLCRTHHDHGRAARRRCGNRLFARLCQSQHRYGKSVRLDARQYFHHHFAGPSCHIFAAEIYSALEP